MNNQDRQAIKILWVQLSAYYQLSLRNEVLEMYVEDLAGLSAETISNAMSMYRRDPKNTRMPLPAQIRSVCEPTVDDDSLAREAASRIVAAIRKFGWPSPNEAKEYIGELGWKVVERNGGWPPLCENLMEDQIGIFTAQARDLAKAQIQFSRAGLIDEAPALPGPKNAQMNELISSLANMKQISRPKEEI